MRIPLQRQRAEVGVCVIYDMNAGDGPLQLRVKANAYSAVAGNPDALLSARKQPQVLLVGVCFAAYSGADTGAGPIQAEESGAVGDHDVSPDHVEPCARGGAFG